MSQARQGNVGEGFEVSSSEAAFPQEQLRELYSLFQFELLQVANAFAKRISACVISDVPRLRIARELSRSCPSSLSPLPVSWQLHR